MVSKYSKIFSFQIDDTPGRVYIYREMYMRPIVYNENYEYLENATV